MVKLTHEKTANTELHYSFYMRAKQHSCVLQSGDIVLCTSETEPDVYDCKLYSLDKHGNPTGGTIDSVCEHYHVNFNILPVTINHHEYICVSCHECKKIYLINPDENQNKSVHMSSRNLVAYEGDVGPMCHGEPGTLYTTHRSGTVSVLDCTTTDFRLKCKLDRKVKYEGNMCYIPSHKLLIISSCHPDRTVAVRESNGSPVWQVTGKINGGEYYPTGGLVYLPQVDMILVGDWETKRIIVVDAASGDVVQTVELTAAGGWIHQLHVRYKQLIITHSDDVGCVKLSWYQVSFISFTCHFSLNKPIKLQQIHDKMLVSCPINNKIKTSCSAVPIKHYIKSYVKTRFNCD